MSSNPFLEGPFAPVREEVTVTDLAVSGTLPAHLDGRYLRNGPNPVGDPDPATYHWFVGDAMVHGIRLCDGRAEWYRSRRVPTPDAGAVQPPNTNVIGHAGRTFAIAESGVPPYELTDELETVGPCDFGGTLAGGYTAHPHRHPATGELHAVSYSADPEYRVRYSVLGSDGRVRRTTDIEVTGSPMMHDFALSENHAVLFDLPVTFDLAQYRAGGVAGGLPTSWDPERPARVGVLPHDGGPVGVRWFDVEPCFVFHPLNAHEVDGRIVVDVVRYPTMFAHSRQGPDSLSTLDRWTVDPAAGTVREERLDDRPQEFPRHDERRTGRAYRYGYAVGLAHGALLKHDVVAGTTAVCPFEPGDVPGEFVFVPTAGTGTEDEGVLMGIVQRSATGHGDLVLLDAGTLETVATVHLPVRVPYGFHGNWVPS